MKILKESWPDWENYGYKVVLPILYTTDLSK